jgi:hypothetical protein
MMQPVPTAKGRWSALRKWFVASCSDTIQILNVSYQLGKLGSASEMHAICSKYCIDIIHKLQGTVAEVKDLELKTLDQVVKDHHSYTRKRTLPGPRRRTRASVEISSDDTSSDSEPETDARPSATYHLHKLKSGLYPMFNILRNVDIDGEDETYKPFLLLHDEIEASS